MDWYSNYVNPVFGIQKFAAFRSPLYIYSRFYLISQMKDLEYLDDRPIEMEERKEAKKMHPR